VEPSDKSEVINEDVNYSSCQHGKYGQHVKFFYELYDDADENLSRWILIGKSQLISRRSTSSKKEYIDGGKRFFVDDFALPSCCLRYDDLTYMAAHRLSQKFLEMCRLTNRRNRRYYVF